MQAGDTTTYALTDVKEKPEVLSSPASHYRTCMQNAGLRGVEGLEFVVDTAGHVAEGSVDVIQSADPILDSIAVEDVRGETFRAGRIGGKAVRVRVQQPFKYGVFARPVVSGDSGVFAASCLDQRPEVVKGPPPAYPEIERQLGHVAVVWAVFTIDSGGHVERGSVTVLPPSSRFDAAARSILMDRQSLFTPGRIFGHSVATRVRMPITFSLCGKAPGASQSADPDDVEGVTVTACPAR